MTTSKTGNISQQALNPDAIYPIPNNYGTLKSKFVNLLTGNAELSIPLFTLSGVQLSYTVSLSYNSSSAALPKPTDNAVHGHGWKLMDYPKVVKDGDSYYFLDGKQALPLVLQSDGNYKINGESYYLWTCSYNSSEDSWKLVDPMGQQYTLKNKSTLDSYPIWHLKNIKNLMTGDELFFTYEKNRLLELTNKTGTHIQLIYGIGFTLFEVKYMHIFENVKKVVLSYDDDPTTSQLYAISTQYNLPSKSNYTQQSLGHIFHYDASDTETPYILKSYTNPEGGKTDFEYYTGDKLIYEGNVVHNINPVTSITQDKTSYGMYYNFSNWAYDPANTYALFNEVQEYPGGVYLDDDYESGPSSPYGYSAYYFFNGQTAANLINLNPEQDEHIVTSNSLLGLAYKRSQYAEKEGTAYQVSGNQTIYSLGTIDTLITYPQAIKDIRTLDGISQETTVIYDASIHLPISSTKDIRNPKLYEGADFTQTTIKTKFEYAFQVYPELLNTNTILPVSQQSQSHITESSETIIGCKTTQWKLFENGKWAPSSTYVLTHEVDSAALSDSYLSNPPSDTWLKTNEITDRNKLALITRSVDANNVVTTQGYDRIFLRFPVSTFINADESLGQANHFGFEYYEYPETWSLTGGEYIETDAHTGLKSYSGTNISIVAHSEKFNPKPDSTYCFSAFVKLKSGYCDISFAGEKPLRIDSISNDNNWQYIQVISENPDTTNIPTLTITGTGAVDDIYFGPVNATRTTSVWEHDDKKLMASLTNNGETYLYDYDLFGNITSKTNASEQLSEAQSHYNSPLGHFTFSANHTFNDNIPNLSTSIRPQTAGVWESFLYPNSSVFSSIQNMTISSHKLEVHTNVTTTQEASATYQPQTTPKNYVVMAEFVPNSLQNDKSIGIRLNGEDTIKIQLEQGFYKLINIPGNTVAQSVSIQNMPTSSSLMITVIDGLNVSAYANSRFLFSYTLSKEAESIDLVSTDAESYFYNFGFAEDASLTTNTFDGFSKHIQTLGIENLDSTLVQESLYNNIIPAVNAVTNTTSLNTGAKLIPQADFASFDSDTMKVTSGTLLNQWHADTYQNQPFTCSTIPYTSPVLRTETNGAGGSFSAGENSTTYTYSENQGNYFDFNSGQMNTTTTIKTNGLQVKQYKTLENITYGTVQIDTDSNTYYQLGSEYDDQLRLLNTFYPNAFTSNSLDRDTYYQKYTYDYLGNTLSLSDSDTGKTQMKYNNTGQLRASQDANQQVSNSYTYTKYDTRGRILEIGTASGDFNSISEAELNSDTWPNSSIATWREKYTYDIQTLSSENNQGNLTKLETQESTLSYAYDKNQNIIKMHQINKVRNTTYTIIYRYNIQGLISEVIVLNAADDIIYNVLYSYDLIGRVSAIGIPDKPDYYARYDYGNGTLKEILNSGMITRNYIQNAAGLIEVISDEYFTEILQYNNEGHITKEDYRFYSHSDNYTTTHTYDKFGRLLTAIDSRDLDISIYYPIIYDPNGNILELVRGPYKQNFEYDFSRNHIKTHKESWTHHPYTYSHDANGNITASEQKGITKIHYDAINGLTSNIDKNGNTIDFTYNGRRSLIAKTTDTQHIDYVRGLNLDPYIEEITEGATTTTLNYIYGPTGLIVINNSADLHENYVVIKDHLRSVRLVVNSSQEVVAKFDYFSYGELIPSENAMDPPIPIRYRFVGEEYIEELEMYNFHARLYDPYAYRFYSSDPYHQFASPYIYSNNPIKYRDATGKLFNLLAVAIVMVALSPFLIGMGVDAAPNGKKENKKNSKKRKRNNDENSEENTDDDPNNPNYDHDYVPEEDFSDYATTDGIAMSSDGMGHHLLERNAIRNPHFKGAFPKKVFDSSNTPRFYPNKPDGSFDGAWATRMHKNIHDTMNDYKAMGKVDAEENPSREDSPNNRIHEYIDAYQDAHLANIRGDLRTPNGRNVLGENIPLSLAYILLLFWAADQGWRPYK